MPVAGMQGQQWTPGRHTCLSLTGDQPYALKALGGGRLSDLTLWRRVHWPALPGVVLQNLLGGAGRAQGSVWAFWTTHVPSPGPGAGYGQRSPSQNRPFPSPNPHGEQRPHPPNPPDPEQTATAPSGLPHQDWWPQPPASWMEGPTWHSGLQAEASIHGATWRRRLPLRPGLPSLERALVFGGALDGAGPGDGAQGRAPAGQCCLQWASRTGPTDPSSSISIPLWGKNVGGGCSGASCPRPHARLGCQ